MTIRGCAVALVSPSSRVRDLLLTTICPSALIGATFLANDRAEWVRRPLEASWRSRPVEEVASQTAVLFSTPGGGRK
jgi:hypothetical protein